MIPFKVYQLKIIKRKFMNWFKRLTGGLNKTASGIKNSIGSIFKGNKLDVSKLEDLEDQLISCDIGIDVSDRSGGVQKAAIGSIGLSRQHLKGA